MAERVRDAGTLQLILAMALCKTPAGPEPRRRRPGPAPERMMKRA